MFDTFRSLKSKDRSTQEGKSHGRKPLFKSKFKKREMVYFNISFFKIKKGEVG